MAEHDHPETDPTPPRDAPVELPLPPLPRPFFLIALGLIGVVLTWLPLSIIARARVFTTLEPRIQIFQDMGVQPKSREQQTNALFADDRAMRPRVEGTVPRGQVEDDDRYYKGFLRVYDPAKGTWTIDFNKSLPDQVKINSPLLHRGQARFNIYCYVCHGLDGSGHGPVNERVNELRNNNVLDMTWTAPAILTDNRIRAELDGQIFNTITNGIRTMPSYGSQIPVADRWAIVAYVRALQFSQQAPAAAPGVVPTGTNIEEK